MTDLETIYLIGFTVVLFISIIMINNKYKDKLETKEDTIIQNKLELEKQKVKMNEYEEIMKKKINEYEEIIKKQKEQQLEQKRIFTINQENLKEELKKRMQNSVKKELHESNNKKENSLDQHGIMIKELDRVERKYVSKINRPYNCHNEEIKYIIKDRSIFELIHFTNIENLQSIVKNGFLSIKLQNKKAMAGINNDKSRFDNKLNATSFSINFPNYKMFYNLRNKNKNNKWVIITLDPSVLYLHEENVFYCESNAASKYIAGKDNKVLKSSLSFKNMFRENMNTNYYGKINREELNIPKGYTTDPQAEVLIEGHIPNKYIRSIYFENYDDFHLVRNNMWDLIKDYDVDIDTKLFNPRNDYKYWNREG